MDVLIKTIKQLKCHKGDGLFVGVIKNILDLCDDTSDGKFLETRRLQVLNFFLSYLKDNKAEDLAAVSKKCKQLFKVTSLRKLCVQSSAIEVLYLLGQGGFGNVHMGNLRRPKGETIMVAVKSASGVSNQEMLEKEAEIMAELEHENVLRILVYQESPPRIVMEFMEMGNLVSALENYSFSTRNLLDAQYDVASGMEYLAKQNYVHRDLACKNILVDHNRRCKVGDFGLAVYVGDSGGVYEAKDGSLLGYNVAPESKITQRFTSKSDVWAMGLLIWEVYLSADQGPTFFPDELEELIGYKKIHLLSWFSFTGILPKPDKCPEELYAYISKKLLSGDPSERPTFAMIKQKISEILFR